MKATYPMKFDLPHTGLEWLQWYDGHKVYHPGFDLNRGKGNEDLGDPVKCVTEGVVEYVSPAPSVLNGQNGGYGWFIIVRHEQYGLWTRYAHLSEVFVKKGDQVQVDTQIARVGNSGTNYSHLHFEVFNAKMFDIQKAHWRPFAFYPSNKPKQYVVEHYVNGLEWIEKINAEQLEPWKQELYDWAKEDISDMDALLGGNIWSLLALVKRKIDKLNK
jgi:murein DD-endopeptidase MepM/ murein hydrolase activator NlpD